MRSGWSLRIEMFNVSCFMFQVSCQEKASSVLKGNLEASLDLQAFERVQVDLLARTVLSHIRPHY